MPYMAFAHYTGDNSNLESSLELARAKYTSLGATRVSGSVALTGEGAGSITVVTMWDTADGYFDARPQVIADPEIAAEMKARNMAPIATMFAEVLAEAGNPEGKYAVSVVLVATDHSHEAVEESMKIVSPLMTAHGVNGSRLVRAFAAGQVTGSYVSIFYVDSLDTYLAYSAAAATDEAFVTQMGKMGGQIMLRQFNRMI